MKRTKSLRCNRDSPSPPSNSCVVTNYTLSNFRTHCSCWLSLSCALFGRCPGALRGRRSETAPFYHSHYETQNTL